MNEARSTQISITLALPPDGEPSVLLRLPNGFFVRIKPDDARRLATALLNAADLLEETEP